MTDESAPTLVTPAPAPVEVTPVPNPNATVASTTVATAPITVTALPIEHKETFWQKAAIDFHEAVKWLEAEIKKI